MPRTPEQNRQRREASERRILAAASETFARHGYDGASVRAIAGAAGVAQGLMYSYFGGKDDLLRAVFRAGARDVAEAFDPAGDPCPQPHQRFEHFIRRSFAIVVERTDFWRLSYLLRFDPRAETILGDDIHLWMEAVRAQLEAMLRAVGHRDAPRLARVLFAAIDGIAQHYALDPKRYPLDDAVDALVTHFGTTTRLPTRFAPARKTRT